MVAVLTGEERQNWINPNLSLVLMALAFDGRFRMSYLTIHSMYPVSAARNQAVREAISRDADWLVMIDNDIVPPFELADALVQAPFIGDIIALPYFVILDGNRLLLCVGNLDGGMMKPLALDELPKGGWTRIEMAGTGCMAISRKVLSRMEQPVFEIITDAVEGQKMSEDLVFTRRATKEGFTIWTNPDLMCGHYRTCDLGMFTKKLTTNPDDNSQE